MKQDRAQAISKRDQLIATALRLFAERGYHATGIDTILKEAGIAKMTLYHHFKSKEELIEAALRQRDAEWRAWFKAQVEERARTPRTRLLAIFDVLADWFQNKNYHGCTFSRAATEFREIDHPVHELAAEHKRIVRGYLQSLAEAAGAADPGRLADQLVLLIDGAVINMEVLRNPDVAKTAKGIAEQLLRAAL